MSQAAPTVSIGLPVFNGERYLEDVIESLLAQTYPDFELIITDNASTDRTEALCREYLRRDDRIRYYRSETNYGAARNFNDAFQLAIGRYFKWAADDDLHEPEFLARCVEVLDSQRDVVLCFTRTEFIDENDRPLYEFKYPIDLQTADTRALFLHFLSAGYVVHEIFGLIRSSALRNTSLIGGYIGSDIVLLGQLALRGRFYQVPELLFQHREHPGRSAIAMKRPTDYTNWFDSAKTEKIVAPFWRRLFEN